MPKEGWESITIHEDTIELWQKSFDENKQILRQRGISTFSGFVNSIMYGIMQDPRLIMQAIEKGNKIALKEFKNAKN